MPKSLWILVLAGLLGLAALQAADIEGTIIVKRKLTKRKVTPSAGSYDRGVAVDLRSGKTEDPLAFERSRVVIYLDGELPSPPVTATLEQRNRQFFPDVLVIPAGSTVSFPNLDPIFHNVFSLSKVKSFDLGNYSKDHTKSVTFTKPGIVFVNCHLHPNMAAAIVVSPNQWSTKSDGTGRFVLSNVPPGAYTIVAWHKAAGTFRHKVTVTESGASDVQFLIPLPEEGPTKEVAQR
jgi:plastocyanin